MLLRKTTWFWKSGLAAISFVLILSISGCSDAPPEENTVSETVIDVQAIQEESEEDADEIISVCIDLYEKAEEENKLADLETIRSIVNRLGENGYSAVDSRNQINMTEPEKVVEFCEKVDAQEEAEITILEISYLGGFVKYDLHTKGGNVDVVRSYYKYENGNMKREVIGNYQAEYWNYTEEGYLMFSGVWFSEELYVLTLSGAEEHTALRVQPLDETYRELSRKYLNPISFERNNMFIVDWSEEDFGDLNFYDMYDILYPNTDIQSVRQESENADKTVMKRSKSEEKEAEEILEICSKTYAKAEKEGKLDDLEMIRDLIKELGEKGFTAVDSENQVNMTEYEKLIQFSEKAEAKKNGRMTVVEVAKGGSCIIRNMETHDGIVNMIRSYCIYENGKLKQSSEDIYRTESWEYTEDGHLMFSGRLAFEGSYEVTRNEIMEYMAYRVLSLDETCRELNRKYILPIGYERNNMFLTDWSEEEFAELDFYDMFDLFYQENHTANGEFTFGNAMGTSAVYLISKEKFEPVIKSKFKISSEVLQSKTVYYPCEEVYEYKPRGLEETEYPEYPYPEVIGYVNNDDGTLTLKVQAVFPYRGVSKAYIHEVTVRDTKDGGIQYVGNRIIEPINNPEIRWHVPRLTRTEWEELYGDN